jgi:hypothetical protein
MNVHFNLNMYWLLPVIGLGLSYWVFYEREDERSTSFMPSLGPLFRLMGATIAFALLVIGLLVFNLWFK